MSLEPKQKPQQQPTVPTDLYQGTISDDTSDEDYVYDDESSSSLGSEISTDLESTTTTLTEGDFDFDFDFDFDSLKENVFEFTKRVNDNLDKFKSDVLNIPALGSRTISPSTTTTCDQNPHTTAETAPSLLPSSHSKFAKFIRKHEIPRKFLHVSIGFITLYLYTQGIQLEQVTPYLATAFILISSIDFIRFRSQSINALYCKACGPLMREKEVNTYNGVIWYLLGLVIVFSLFPKDISLMAVLLLSWADTSASTFGRLYGHLTPKIARGKSLAGSIAAFITGVIASALLYGYFIPHFNHVNSIGQIMYDKNHVSSYLSLPILLFLSGLVGSVSEGIDLWNMDDNFTIPILSSVFLYSAIKLSQY